MLNYTGNYDIDYGIYDVDYGFTAFSENQIYGNVVGNYIAIRIKWFKVHWGKGNKISFALRHQGYEVVSI